MATATVAASLLVQFYWWHPRNAAGTGNSSSAHATSPVASYVATLTRTADCVWENPRESRRTGSRLQPGELRLKRGLVQIRFDHGPALLVEGPAHIRLESSTAATVNRGKVVFRTDESAAPFDLHTPSATLMDLGTEYAVAVNAEGEEVQVFEGEVERSARQTAPGTEPDRLKAGEARRFAAAPNLPSQAIEFDPTRFVRQLFPPGQRPVDLAAGLLAYEGFEYQDPDILYTGRAANGFGWAGPWLPTFGNPHKGGHPLRASTSKRASIDRALPCPHAVAALIAAVWRSSIADWRRRSRWTAKAFTT